MMPWLPAGLTVWVNNESFFERLPLLLPSRSQISYPQQGHGTLPLGIASWARMGQNSGEKRDKASFADM